MEKWDYNMPKLASLMNEQKDWNQTLVTKFNKLAAENEEVVIRVPNKFIPLIKSIAFYNESTNKIGHRFIVEFYNSYGNTIKVGDKDLEIQNY